MLALLQAGADRVQHPVLFGVQFRDAVTGRVVDEGLAVTLRDLWRPQRVQALAANRSGVFVLHRWPGLHGLHGLPGLPDLPGSTAAAAASQPSPPLWASPAEAERFELQVRDTLGRYLPARLAPTVPGAGLWSPPGGGSSPPAAAPAAGQAAPLAAPHVPLFSAATRPLPPALASLRVELRRASQPGRPARWARLELWLGSLRIAEGQADEAGRALLVFALPRPREAALGSSPAGRPPAFEWTVTLRAFWSAGFADATTVPAFDDVFSQPEAGLLQRALPAPPLSPLPLPLPPLLLRAGEPLMAHQPPESFVYVAE